MKRLSAFVIPFALSACAVTPSQQSGTQPVEIRFAAQINGQAFECCKSYSGVGTTKSTITPSDFRLYVSKVELLTAHGKAVPVAMARDKT